MSGIGELTSPWFLAQLQNEVIHLHASLDSACTIQEFIKTVDGADRCSLMAPPSFLINLVGFNETFVFNAKKFADTS